MKLFLTFLFFFSSLGIIVAQNYSREIPPSKIPEITETYLQNVQEISEQRKTSKVQSGCEGSVWITTDWDFL